LSDIVLLAVTLISLNSTAIEKRLFYSQENGNCRKNQFRNFHDVQQHEPLTCERFGTNLFHNLIRYIDIKGYLKKWIQFLRKLKRIQEKQKRRICKPRLPGMQKNDELGIQIS
jgi:hypothetical protein